MSFCSFESSGPPLNRFPLLHFPIRACPPRPRASRNRPFILHPFHASNESGRRLATGSVQGRQRCVCPPLHEPCPGPLPLEPLSRNSAIQRLLERRGALERGGGGGGPLVFKVALPSG